MKLPRFLAAARQDVRSAVDFYNAEKPGLGREFWWEIVACLQRIQENPRAWTDIGDGVRRCITHRFPYGVLYMIHDDEPIVVAVMHVRRHPDSWRNRPEQDAG